MPAMVQEHDVRQDNHLCSPVLPVRRRPVNTMSNLQRAAHLVPALLQPAALAAQTAYYRHAVFDNSLQPDYYFHSSAQATAPSTLEQQHWRLPVDATHFLSPPNALRLHWQSQPGGGWDAEIHLVNFRNRFPEPSGHTLYFWVYAPHPITAADLPDVVLSDARSGLQVATFPGSFTAPEPLGKYTGGRARHAVDEDRDLAPVGATTRGSGSVKSLTLPQ
jgi:hypothetical protein